VKYTIDAFEEVHKKLLDGFYDKEREFKAVE